jgi:hypothetical protein
MAEQRFRQKCRSQTSGDYRHLKCPSNQEEKQSKGEVHPSRLRGNAKKSQRVEGNTELRVGATGERSNASKTLIHGR